MSWWTAPQGEIEARARVVVVGAGAAGAFVALTLAEAGLDVLVLEEGFHPTPKPTSLQEAMLRLYAEGSFRTSMGSAPPMPVVGGRGLGGSTLVNSALCFQTPRSTLQEWNAASEAVAPGGVFADEDAYYAIQAQVEALLHVATTPDHLLSGNDRAQQAAARRLGWSGFNARRNAPDCSGCGRCHLVCPHGGKASVDQEILPRAAAAGARILAGCRTEGLAVGRAWGSLVDERGQPRGRFSVQADHVVLSAGAISTPRLLHDAGLVDPDGEVGRGLCLQPVHSVLGLLPEGRVFAPGATQGHVVDEFVEDRMIFETNPTLAAMLGNLPFRGMEMKEMLARGAHIANTGGLIRDESRGRVRGSFNGVARIRYDLGEADLRRICRVLQRGARLWFEGADAEWVGLVLHGGKVARSMAEVEAMTPQDLDPQRLISYASHPQATCSVGRVTDEAGALLEQPGISCIDASSLPSNVGRNPQISVMTVARVLSARLAERLGGKVQPLGPVDEGAPATAAG